MRLLIADDLTGCCDAGIAFAKRGLRTMAAFCPEVVTRLPDASFDGLAVNTETRNLAATAAGGIVMELANRLRARSKPDLIFKKIDSTLRGHIGIETDIIRGSFGLPAAFIAPASPDHGRCVVDGRLLVDGVPVNETVFAQDPLAPVASAEIISLLPDYARASAALLPLDIIYGGASVLRKAVVELLNRGVRYIIFDAKTHAHLSLIAETGLQLPARPLFVGSAGLAAALAQALAPEELPEPDFTPVDRVFMVCGSAHKATHAQVDALAEAGLPVLRLSADFRDSAARQKLVESMRGLLERGSAVLAAPLERLPGMKAGQAISRAIAEISVAVLRDLPARPSLGMIMTGGATAYDILSKIGGCMRLEAEPEPGVVVSSLADGDWRGMTVATKAGGFGNPHTLLDTINFLCGRKAG